MKLKKRLIENKLFLSGFISLIILIVLSMLFWGGVFGVQQLRAGDYLYSSLTASPEIVIVAIDDKSIQEIGRWPWDREVFAEVLGKLEKAKTVGIDVSFLEKTDDDAELQSAISDKVLLALEYEGWEWREGIYGKNLLKPVIKADYGCVNLLSDKDGVVRSFPSLVHGEENYSSFGVRVAEMYSGEKVNLKEKELINFFKGFKKVSLVDVLRSNDSRMLEKGSSGVLNEEPGTVFDNKIVLIGATASDLHDNYLVPVSKGGRMSGVEIQANIVQTILSGKFLTRQSKGSAFLVMLLLSGLMVLVLWKLKTRYSWLAGLLLFLAYIYFASLVFKKGVIVNLIYPGLVILLNYVFISVGFYVSESRHKQWIMKVFGKYVSEDVAKEVLKKGYDEKLLERGKRKEITIMFADIRGFTSMSEKLSPEKVVDLLNLYLGKITQIIFDNKGTIDKYIGDAVMAVWNAPLKQEGHELLAVKAGLEMQKAVKDLGEGVNYGIGINTGPAVVGNMGSERRMEYTAIGDAVNLSSRLCSAAKSGEVVISEEVYKRIKDKVEVKDLGEVKVKGKEKEVKIYKVLKVK